MVDKTDRTKNQNGGGDESSDPEVPPRDVPADAEAHDARQHHHRAQRAVADAYEWVTDVALPWVWKHIIRSSNFWTAAATIVIAIATIVYTHYARKQWEEMERQSRQNRNAVEATQRAYVDALEAKVVHFEIGKPLEAQISYKNAGFTPARHLTVSAYEFLGQPNFFFSQELIVVQHLTPGCASPMEENAFKNRTEFGETLPAGIERVADVNVLFIENSRKKQDMEILSPLTIDESWDVIGLKKNWYIMLSISYYDQFGNCHTAAAPFVYWASDHNFHTVEEGWKAEDYQYEYPN